MKDFEIINGKLSWRKNADWLYPDGNYPEWAKKNGKILVKYKGKDTRVYIPDGIDEIGAEAFRKNKYIEVVDFPESVYDIGAHALYNCQNLKTVIFRGYLYVWSDFITKKQQVQLVFLKNSLDDVDNKYQEKALLGFIYCVENDLMIDDTVFEKNLIWIKRRRKKLYQQAVTNHTLLQILLNHHLVPKQEIDELLELATASGDAEATAMILNYAKICQ